jgi:hypothetical protein
MQIQVQVIPNVFQNFIISVQDSENQKFRSLFGDMFYDFVNGETAYCGMVR